MKGELANGELALFVGRDSGGFMRVLQEGTYIRHFQYGLGVMAASETERTPLDFDLHGPKKFVAKIMTVKLTEATPGKRPKRPKKATRAGHRAGAK